MKHVIDIAPGGSCQFVYSDALAAFIAALHRPEITRASHVEPVALFDGDGCTVQWSADLSPVAGPLLGPFPLRESALAAEHAWLNEHYIGKEDTYASELTQRDAPGRL